MVKNVGFNVVSVNQNELRSQQSLYKHPCFAYKDHVLFFAEKNYLALAISEKF